MALVGAIGERLGFWVFLLTGKVLPGFEPETRGMEGIKKLVRGRFSEVRQLGTAELADWLADANRPQPQLLDVREPDEFAVSHLPGAQRIDPDARGPVLEDLAATNQPLVLYCSVGYRSSALARRLLKAGRTDVFNLEGSIFQWANEGRPLVGGNGAATQIHPYGRRWRLLLKPDRRGAID